MVTTRVPGKFGLVSNLCSKVLVPDTNIWSKRSLRACSRILAALPGAKHLERCFAVKRNCIWPVEREGNTFLDTTLDEIVQRMLTDKTFVTSTIRKVF